MNTADLEVCNFSVNIWALFFIVCVLMMILPNMMEKKNISGIQYGRFLSREYKTIFGFRVNFLLSIMAVIQCLYSISLFIYQEIINWMNIVLWVNITILLYYFIFYIIIKNPRVKREIYKAHFLGLYCESEEIPVLNSDLVTNMSNGSSTDKTLSNEIIEYFDEISPKTRITFEESFGPTSLLYSRTRKIRRYYDKHFKNNPYDYSTTSGLNPISYEFFLMFQNSNQQTTWALEILALFNKDYTKGYSDQRIDNLIRLMAHINKYGNDSIICSDEFLSRLTVYLIEAIKGEPHYDMISYRAVKEIFLLKEVFSYISTSLSVKEDKAFYASAVSLNDMLHTDKGYIGHFNYKKHIGDIMKVIYREDNKSTIRFSAMVLEDYKALYNNNPFERTI